MDVFISYSRDDSDFAHPLADSIDDSPDFDVWIDRDDILGGDEWMTAVVQGIDRCASFVVVLSPASVESKYVKKEVSLAFQKDKTLIPVRLRPYKLSADLSFQLAGLHFVDFGTGDHATAYSQLMQALQGEARPAQTIPQEEMPRAQGQFQLFGRWQVQLQQMVTGASAYGEYLFMPSGLFTGQLMTPLGPTYAEGNWQLLGNQLVLQGTQALVANPWQVVPYAFGLQIMQAGDDMFSGVTTGNEQVYFQRLG